MELATLYEAASLERAFGLAREYHTYSHRFIRGLLESTEQSAATLVAAPRAEPLVSGSRALPAAAVHGDLSAYQRLLEAVR